MQKAHAECTVLPTGESLDALRELLHQQVRLVAADGRSTPVPPQVQQAMVEVVQALTDNQAVTISPHCATVRTQEAADLLGVSRPTLIRLLDQGAIPYEQPCRHRRILLTDLLAYQRSIRGPVMSPRQDAG